jgi:molecular chaperone HtpG
VQFSAVLYIPETSVERLGFLKAEMGVDLYSRKVLIQKGSKDILPEYLRFIEGVIDSEDIPLNISRETIQSHLKIDRIRKHVIKQIFSHLQSIKTKDREKYLRIWENFHRNLKEGVASDPENRDRIAPLLLFHSSKRDKAERVDLKEVVKGMPEEQDALYYLTGLDLEALEKDPALEAFQKKGWEVLLLEDPLDEFVLEQMGEFDGKPFKPAQSADIKLARDKEAGKDSRTRAEALVGYLKEIYGDQVAEVKVSERLVDSPAMLVNPGGPSIHVEKILKMAHRDYQFSRKVLEINPDNPLIREMIRIHSRKPDAPLLKTMALQLLDNLRLREGVMEDMEAAVLRIQEIMLQAAKTVRTPVRKKS